MIIGVLLGFGIALMFAWVLIPLFRPQARSRALADTSAFDSLTESKNAIYRSMLDLDFDRSVGKVSEEDHAVLRRQHEADAAEILDEIEKLDGSRGVIPGDPIEEEIAAARRRRRE
jgi:hypothetical protein